MAALLAAGCWAFFLWKTPLPGLPKFVLKKQNIFAVSCIGLVAVVVSLLVNSGLLYASDEVFSAVNFGSLPSFQAISNYPLPNNHLGFNAINGALFFWSEDLVLTGRLISLACYMAVLGFSWFFLGKWVESIWLKCLILLVVAVQFPVLGFSGQARGYELVLLCSCLSLGSFVAYFSHRSPYALSLHTACNVVGILTLPTYLYWWLGLGLAALLWMVSTRRLDWAFVRSSITGVAASLVLMLPLLTFSGLASLTDNRYVQPAKTSAWHFLTHLNEKHYFNGLFSEWFSSGSASLTIGLICGALPLFLFIYPRQNKERRLLGIAYYSIVFAFLIMSVFMLKLPFYRNLIAHGYLALIVSIIAVLPWFRAKWSQVFFGIALFSIGVLFLQKNNARIPNDLYYYDVKTEFEKTSRIPTSIDVSKPIHLDYESFYWWYVLREKYPEKQLMIEPNRPMNIQQRIHEDSISAGHRGMYQLLE
jgi:hypothetical protein